MLNRRHATGLIAALAVLAGSGLAHAQSFPSKSIRWVVPYPAGGGSDFLARTVGQQLSTQVNQQVLVDNKPGGNTAIAASEVARAPADGYTILSADNGTMVFNTALYAKLSYDPDKDLRPVTLMGKFPMILVAGPGSTARDAKDFIAQAKAKPGSISYGSAGAGSPHHLAMELLKVSAGLHMVHIPYRGAAPALTDVAGGQVDLAMMSVNSVAGFIESKRVKALGVTSEKPSTLLPAVPTIASAGLKGYGLEGWYAAFAPAGTPAPVVERLNAAFARALNDPEVRKALTTGYFEPQASTPAALGEFIARETANYRKLVTAQGIKGD